MNTPTEQLLGEITLICLQELKTFPTALLCNKTAGWCPLFCYLPVLSPIKK